MPYNVPHSPFQVPEKYFNKYNAMGLDSTLSSVYGMVENMDDNNVESIFMETDFLDRSVLKLITHFQYEPLMKDHKISDLLDLLWVGKNSYDCDGRETNFSLLSYLLSISCILP